MIDQIYVEREVADHWRTRAICGRFPAAQRIVCERYTEVFNPRAQNFRLQKRRPALILAFKHRGLVLPAPAGYGVGGRHNYYFSHMLNCPYDCRYCFLQGMYRSAHYLLFVNYEAFGHAIDGVLGDHPGEPVWFYSGYDCDSLAFEPVSRFAEHFLPFFEQRPRAFLELRTKSTQVRGLLGREPLENVVVAFSFTPQPVAHALEHRVPAVRKRIDAMVRLQRAGWAVGLRLDPMIHEPRFDEHYRDLIEALFARVDGGRLHSVSLGPFRLPRGHFRVMERLYPDEPLFAGPLGEHRGMVSYGEAREREMMGACMSLLRHHVPEDRIRPCSWG